METIRILLHALVALVIINVWLFRKNKSTPWRGGNAASMSKEFEQYGLSRSMMVAVGAFKLACALCLIAGIWIPGLTVFAAVGLTIALLGAVVAHVRINDPLFKSVPAASLMAMSVAVVAL